jgi:hypothetical protein
LKVDTAALIAVLGSAALLRVAGVGSAALYPDEAQVVGPALALSWRDPNPHVFHYGSFTFYAFKLASVVSSWMFRFVTDRDPTLPESYVICRLLSVLFGVATVALCFCLGRLLAGRLVGVVAAALVAVSPTSVALSHAATVDAAAGFWSALAWVGMAGCLTGGTRWGSRVAGIATGVAMGTKYNAALLLLPIVLIALGSNRAAREAIPRRSRQWLFAGLVIGGLAGCAAGVFAKGAILAAASAWTTGGSVRPSYVRSLDKVLVGACVFAVAGVLIATASLRHSRWAYWIVDTLTGPRLLSPVLLAALVFFLVSPYTFLDPRRSVPDIAYQMNKTIVGPRAMLSEAELARVEATAGPLQPDRLYYIRAVKDEWGWVVAASMLAGAWILGRLRPDALIACGTTVLVVLTLSLGWRYDAVRYLYPLWPPLSLFAALGLTSAVTPLVAVTARAVRRPSRGR